MPTLHASTHSDPSTALARTLRGRGVRATLFTGWLALLVGCGVYDGAEFDSGETTLLNSSSSGISAIQGLPAFQSTVYPILRANCDGCHEPGGQASLDIAHSDPLSAYSSVVDNGKVDLGDSARSRLVLRLSSDNHNCWSSCGSDANEMAAAIDEWADLVIGSTGGTAISGLQSASVRWEDGELDGGSARDNSGVIAMYEFKEGSGDTAHDTSGVSPAMDLTIDENRMTWLGNYGLESDHGMAMADPIASRKIFDRIAAFSGGTGQYTVELWIQTADIDQAGPARIVSYADRSDERNFSVGQTQYTVDYRNRGVDPSIDEDGRPALITDELDRDLVEALQHVVVTYDPIRGRQVYVNAVHTDDPDPTPPALLWNWDRGADFAIGAEVNNSNRWEGQFRHVAVFDRAINIPQIEQNHAAGVGKRLGFAFDLSQWVGAGTSLNFVVSEFDAYSYLFCRPTVFGTNSSGLRFRDIRIAVNGNVSVSGQAFRRIDTVTSRTGEELSGLCSVIPKDLGIDDDVFTIVFEILANFEDPVLESLPNSVIDTTVLPATPDTGMRTFDKINQSMATLTGVAATTPSIAATYTGITQQLPSTEDLRSFVSANQIGISKLSLEYCSALVDDPVLRDDFFGRTPVFEWTAVPATAFSTQTKRDQIVDALYASVVGQNLVSQPDYVDVQPVLDQLILDLAACSGGAVCDQVRTRTIVKATCSASLSSAAVSIH